MKPFAPIAFALVKDCKRIVGLDIVQLAGPYATVNDVVKDGFVLSPWRGVYFSAFVTSLTFQLTSTAQAVPLSPVQSVAVTSVCPVTISGNATAGGTLAGTPLVLTVTCVRAQACACAQECVRYLRPAAWQPPVLYFVVCWYVVRCPCRYVCTAAEQGVQNNTIVLDFDDFGTVSFNISKFVGYRPGFDLLLSSPNVTEVPLTDLAVLRNGLPVGNWSTLNAFAYKLPASTGVLTAFMSVATGLPFQMRKPFTVTSPDSHNGQCDPHIRPDPTLDYFRIGAKPELLEITFWCKTNTDGAGPTFTATFEDIDEYFTTSFAFRKVSHFLQRLLASPAC